MILALDISMVVGWAAGSGEDINFGTRSFVGYAGDDLRVGRKFRDWLDPFLDDMKPSTLVIERPFFRGHPTWILIGMAWEAQRAAEMRGINRFDYSPSQIKKQMTGNGYAKKAEVVVAAREMGHNVANDHEADAIGLIMVHRRMERKGLVKPNQTLKI